MSGSPVACADDDRVVLPVQLRLVQRMLLVRELFESGPAATTLLLAGLSGLAVAGATTLDRTIAAVEIASAGWMLVLLQRGAREVLARTRATAAPASDGDAGAYAVAPLEETLDGIEWSGVAGASMLAVEVWQHWHQTGRVQRPVLLLAVFTLWMATGGRRLIARVMRRRIADRRPRLSISRDGVDYRGSKRRRWVARWDDVERVEQDAESVRLTLGDGRVRELRARDHVDGHRLVIAARRALATLLPARLAHEGVARLTPPVTRAVRGAVPEVR